MSRLKPYELLGKDPVGIKTTDLIRMLQHYGFEPTYGGEHITFKHRDYFGEIKPISVPHKQGGGEAEPKMVRQASEACMEVKRLNKEKRSAECLEPLPDWVSGVVPPIFSKRVESDVMRLLVEPNGEPGRGYSIKYNGNKLVVASLNYPDQYFTFNVENEHKPAQQFLAMFTKLDHHVLGHMRALRQFYHESIRKLEAGNGFVIVRDDPDAVELPMIHVTHPQYHLDYTIPLCRDNDPIPDYIATMVGKINNAHSGMFYRQIDFLEGLARRGWKCEQVQSADGQNSGQLVLTRGDKTFTIATHGKLEMFDMDLVRTTIAQHETPTNRVGEAHYRAGLQQQAAASSVIQL